MKLKILLIPVLLCAAGNIFALGKSETKTDAQKIEVSGKVRLVGNSPMAALVISTNTREWYIEADEQDKLFKLQQQTVTVRAEEYYLDMVYGNGLSTERQYYLKNITVIKPKR